MAESVKNSEKLSMTSDLGSSSCDNDADLSSDARDQSDDVISVAGSTSLTVDSLEDEDCKEQRCSELPITSILQSEMLKISNSKDGPSVHKQRERPVADGCKNKHKFSGMIVTRSIKSKDSVTTGNSDHDQRSSDKQKTNCVNASEKSGCQAEEKQTTDKTDTKPSSMTLGGSGTISEESQHPDSSNTKPTDEPHSVSMEANNEKLSLQKSRSLTEETSTDPSPKPTKRSGIPRRKNSTHSMVTVVSSGRSTPQNNSPARFGRSMTLDSASCDHQAALEAVLGSSAPVSRNAPRSFPTSPIKSAGKLKRSASQCECISVSGVSCPPLVLSRSEGDRSIERQQEEWDNITSRLRFEKHHHDHGTPAHGDFPGLSYLTPSQRKELAVRELRVEVRELTRQLEERDREIEQLKKRISEQKTDQELFEELESALSSAEAARKEVTSLQELHTESVKKAALLQQQLDDVRKDMRNKLAESEEIFLEMYNKGRQSAIFEHEEEMEIKRKGGRSQEATEKELYNKLVKTQAELAKWQTIQRHESYHTMPIPGTEAETTLRFLKDSVFHFLTTDKNSSDEHLRAIVRILHFSEMQREKIAQAIIFKRNKTGW